MQTCLGHGRLRSPWQFSRSGARIKRTWGLMCLFSIGVPLFVLSCVVSLCFLFFMHVVYVVVLAFYVWLCCCVEFERAWVLLDLRRRSAAARHMFKG